jgi:hypothetical protein
MRVSHMPTSYKDRLPSINQIVINQEFLGLGKELGEKKDLRRSVDAQTRSLENHVLSL